MTYLLFMNDEDVLSHVALMLLCEVSDLMRPSDIGFHYNIWPSQQQYPQHHNSMESNILTICICKYSVEDPVNFHLFTSLSWHAYWLTTIFPIFIQAMQT